MNTRIILPTPCRNPDGGPDRTRCTGQVTDWEEHGNRRYGRCNTCHHDYVHTLGPYEAHRTTSEEAARG